MSRTNPVEAGSPPKRPRWKSVDQLSDLWGMSRARTRLVVQALVRSGRMESRPGHDTDHTQEYRVLSR